MRMEVENKREKKHAEVTVRVFGERVVPKTPSSKITAAASVGVVLGDPEPRIVSSCSGGWV